MTVVRFVIGALGALALGIGAMLVAVAFGLFSWIGGGDSVPLPEIHLTTSEGVAVAEDVDFLFDDARFVPDLGTASLRVRSTDGTPVFAGIAPASAADRLLESGVDPSVGTIWVASDSGASAFLDWEIEPGEWSFVVAGADGSVPHAVVIDGELGAGPFRLAAGTVGALGTASVVAGGLLLIVAFAARRSAPPRDRDQRTTQVPATV